MGEAGAYAGGAGWIREERTHRLVRPYRQHFAGHLPVQRYARLLFHRYFRLVCRCLPASRLPQKAVAHGLFQRYRQRISALLCLLLAFSATVYETMQVIVPDTWEHFC